MAFLRGVFTETCQKWRFPVDNSFRAGGEFLRK
jgi:hypothetical protein